VWFSRDGREQLFDLEGDPQELHDLAGREDQRPTLIAWRNRLIEELRDREEGFVEDGRLIPGRPVTPVLSKVLPVSAAG
jgi:arylsulfatase